jgi:hypothetical protein
VEKRYQVFISSTYLDLHNARREVSDALLQAECFPSGMELFPAADDEQFEVIKSFIDESDYYLIISAGRYGSIHSKTGLSYTEMEFDYARRRKKPIIVLLHKNPRNLPADQCETTDLGRKALENFRNKLQIGRMVRFWEDYKDLGKEVVLGLNWAKKKNPARGWIRPPEGSDLTTAGEGTTVGAATESSPGAEAARPPHTADGLHGSYTKEQCREYTGFFFAYRRTFSNPQNFDRSLFEFTWSGERSCLVFTETQTYPTPKGLELRTHKGEVFFNRDAPLVHLMITDRGAVRLLTLSRLRVDDATLHGIILSQYRKGTNYAPSIAPIMLQRQDLAATREDLLPQIGVIRPQTADYPWVAKYLIEIERDIGVFALASRMATTQEPAAESPAPAPVLAPVQGTDHDAPPPPVKH